MKRRPQFYCIFVLYCFILAAVLFIRESDGLGVSAAAVTKRLETDANMVPFRTIKSYHSAYLNGNMSSMTYYLNIYGNAVLFLPMGIILPKIKPVLSPLWFFIPMIFLIIATVELSQLFCGVGRADIDDVILNISGALFGRILVSMHLQNQEN